MAKIKLHHCFTWTNTIFYSIEIKSYVKENVWYNVQLLFGYTMKNVYRLQLYIL